MPDAVNGLRLVCLDLGGVVIRICGNWSDACRQGGVPPRGDVDEVLGRSPDWVPLKYAFESGRVSFEEYSTRFSALLDGLLSPDEIRRVHPAWIRGVVPGAGELLQRIEAAGLATACMSNTNEDHWRQLQSCPFMQSFQFLFASHLAGACKPAVDFYRHVEAVTGYRGEEVLLLDDTEENIRGAESCGWQGAVIGAGRASPVEEANAALDAAGLPVIRPSGA